MFKEKELLILSNELWNKSRDEYSQIYSDEDVYKDIMDYRQYHCKIVADLAIEMFDEYYSKLFTKSDADDIVKNSLYFACLVHDIKKISPKHSKAGAKFIMESSEAKSIECINLNLVKQIIKYHKSKKNKIDGDYLNRIFKIDDKFKMLVLIVRISDKVSKLVFKSEYMYIDEDIMNIVIDKVVNNSNEFVWCMNDFNGIFSDIKNKFVKVYCNK